MKGRTNFDRYLEEQLKDPYFAARFKEAGEAWDVAMQLAALRKEFGLSQKELAERIGTSQQQISRLESPGYEGHSLSMIRRVAEVLGATVRVRINGASRRESMPWLNPGQNMAVGQREARQGLTGQVLVAKKLKRRLEPSVKASNGAMLSEPW
jgi:transcriptional regulator with XRE-family HTH domain